MSQLMIKGNVRIGHVYDCLFGQYKKQGGGLTTVRADAALDYNFPIPNEIIKTRLVVVIGKHRGQYIVVPISATKEHAKKETKEPEYQGFHVRLEHTDIPTTPRYPYGVDRWALCNLITTVDGGRLRDLYHSDQKTNVEAQKVSDVTLLKIREGVIISIGMRDILNVNIDTEGNNN
ncbi:type II toxin-antitoxin system PemK/MazF family toxin [Vibrio alginolyticus]|uniref:type II toxin-antitoxin system PemK/MazF family toxin n=1 Tax=Vibrio alginolyticus TaxID=663 RepID=UPI00211A83B2|nr:type II toxin-antitoxin system PemK/MazF family toxin [Vibrio alginolyticus]MCQ9091251.1 type II toxin-antitoxin system PemK/MazF family toxin [Vibrio alginolyticus]